MNNQLEQGRKDKASLDEKIGQYEPWEALHLTLILSWFSDDINLYIDTTQRELKRVVSAKEVSAISITLSIAEFSASNILHLGSNGGREHCEA